jgi:eukaryotic-like serine/threonine-protein kinase
MNQDDKALDQSTANQADPQQTLDPYNTVDSQQQSSSRILGNYRLLGQLGQGGMGIVYEAESLIDGSKVALKTLQSGNAETLARLKAEFRVLADLAHPNLVQLGELNTTGHDPFFTMEIVRGVSLDQYISASMESVAAIPSLPFNEDRLRKALVQLASGLTALHSAGLVHRDIKPSNVMVNHEGRVVILDMGLAAESKALNDSSASIAIAGTPYFMAPEQMQGKEVTAASDWYAVGVMLFEAMTGEKLFHSRRIGDLASEKLSNRRCQVREFLPAIADDLSRLCERMLSVKPEERPSGHEVLELLSGTVSSKTETSAWVGREQELHQLMTVWDKVCRGMTQVVLIAGPSGIGKTSLADHFIGELRKQKPVIVLRGRCYENEAVPYRGIDSVVDSLGGYLQRLPHHQVERILPIDLDVLCQVFPVLRSIAAVAAQLRPLEQATGDARELAQRGIAALRELLCRLAKFESVVLFIDDLQQGDEDTAAVFRDLFRQGQSPALLCLCTYRSEDAETSICLQRIRRAVLSKAEQSLLVEQLELHIDRLTSEEALGLAQALLHESNGGGDKVNFERDGEENIGIHAAAAKIAAESGGDPLFIRMLVESQLRDSANWQGLQDESLGNTKDAWNLKTVIEHRLAALEPMERRAIEILATAGRPLVARELESIVGGGGSSVGLIRSLRIQKFVKRLGDRERIELYHDKIRETALSIVPAHQQAKYCLTLADYLEQSGKTLDVELLADLCRRAGQFSRAGVYYQQSARIAAASFAFNRAIECYRYAIDFLQDGNGDSVTLRKGLADALASASRSAEAAAEYLKAAEMAATEDKPQLQQLAALRYLTSGHVERGIATLRQVLEHYRLPWPASKLSAIAGLLMRNARLQQSSLKAKDGKVVSEKDLAMHDACWTAAAGLSLVDPLRGSYYVSENATAIAPFRRGRNTASRSRSVHRSERDRGQSQSANDLSDLNCESPIGNS